MTIPRTLKPGDAIEVIWLDSHFNEAGWQSEGDIGTGEDVTIRSVCIYVGRDRNYIHTVADRSEKLDGVMRDLKIPRGCIQTVRRLYAEQPNGREIS